MQVPSTQRNTLDQLVRATGLYRRVISERAGIHPNYIGDLIAGRRRMTPYIAKRLAPVLGVSVETLMKGAPRIDS